MELSVLIAKLQAVKEKYPNCKLLAFVDGGYIGIHISVRVVGKVTMEESDLGRGSGSFWEKIEVA